MTDRTGLIQNIDFPTTLLQVNDDLHQLEGAIKRLSESLRKRGLEMNPDVANGLQSLRLSAERVKRQGEDLLQQSARLQQIVQASAQITSSLELGNVLDDVMESVIALSGAERAYLMLYEPDLNDLTIRATHHWNQEEGAVDDSDAEFSRTVVHEAFNTREPILTMNAQNDTRFQEKKSVIGLALRSVLCIPLILDGNRAIGVLYADNRMRSGVFSKEMVQLLTAFSTQAAIAIEKARLHGEELRRIRLEKDLSVAREIQFSLLPKTVPAVSGWEFAAIYQPARVVGGDFYDFFGIAPYQGVVIADVADKGVGAALFMGLSRTMIRTAALSTGSPAEALAQANLLITQDSERSNLFLSAFYAVINTATGRVIHANAGHNPPFIYRAATGQIELLKGKGIVLGVFEDISLYDVETQMEPDDCLIFYTDGVNEAMDADGNEFTEAALWRTISSVAQFGAQTILDHLMAAIAAHTRGAPPSDDVTIVIVKRYASG